MFLRQIEESEKAGSRRELNPVYIEDCEDWWLSGWHSSVAEHWRLKPEVSRVRFLVTAGLFTFFYLPQKHLPNLQHEARVLSICTFLYVTKVTMSVPVVMYHN